MHQPNYFCHLTGEMLRTILPFYIICFVLYVIFTRQPDYPDGVFTSGVIHNVKDSNQKQVPKVFFTVNNTTYSANASYLLRNLKENEPVTVIYDTSKPAYAAVYKWWGYWLQWDELLASIIIPLILYYAATLITNRPTPEALIDEVEMSKPAKRRKYD